MKYLIFFLLFVFAFLSQFTSSEFWPISISKTWLDFAHFEKSMLQKPLLTLLLSVFHAFQLTDITHLILVKFIFTLIALTGLLFFSKFIIEFTKSNNTKNNTIAILASTLVLISPTYLSYFFSVRSDQVAFVLFSVFLYLCEKKRLKLSFITLLLIPTFGIKEIIFLIPGSIYFFSTFKENFSKKSLFFIGYTASSILVWILALNIEYAFYLKEIYAQISLAEKFNFYYLKAESPALILSLIACIYIFISKSKEMYKIALLSISFFTILLIYPQAYYFFVASLVPFIYLPLFLLAFKEKFSKNLSLVLISLQFIFTISFKIYNNTPFFNSVFLQYRYIYEASKIIQENNFTYLDGLGILPRQKHYPCFVSPFDDQANNSCIDRLKNTNPQAIIITNRLSGLGDLPFKKVQIDYEQILPNLWIYKDLLNSDIKSKVNLSEKVGVPMFIF